MSRNMKIHQKTTFSSRMKSRSHLSQLTFYTEAGGSYEDLGLDPTLILRLTEGKPTLLFVLKRVRHRLGRFTGGERQYAISR